VRVGVDARASKNGIVIILQFLIRKKKNNRNFVRNYATEEDPNRSSLSFLQHSNNNMAKARNFTRRATLAPLSLKS
jgi:hypothetical protein